MHLGVKQKHNSFCDVFKCIGLQPFVCLWCKMGKRERNKRLRRDKVTHSQRKEWQEKRKN